jgi:hypothetical protein
MQSHTTEKNSAANSCGPTYAAHIIRGEILFGLQTGLDSDDGSESDEEKHGRLLKRPPSNRGEIHMQADTLRIAAHHGRNDRDILRFQNLFYMEI